MKIDKNTIYTCGDYSFKNFVLLDDQEVKNVWEWRNHPEIRKWMTNPDPILFQDHVLFIKHLREKKDIFYWLVFKYNKPFGIADVLDVNPADRSGFFGFYLSPEILDNGEGLEFHYYCKYFLFNLLGFENLKGEILAGNSKPLLISLFMNVKIEGTISKSGKIYLKMKGNRMDFHKINPEKLTWKFVKFVKENPVKWDKLLMEYT